jgi:hypothetical protein
MSSEQQLEALISDQEKPCRAAFYHVSGRDQVSPRSPTAASQVLLRNAEERLRCQVESDFNVYFPVSASVAPFSHLKDESSVRLRACFSGAVLKCSPSTLLTDRV